MGIRDKSTLNSFEHLYNETYQNTLKYVVCKCSNLEDVKDIMQNIYVDFYKLLKKKEIIELENVNAFIIGIAKHKVNDYYGLKYKIQSLFISSTEETETIEIKADEDIENSVLDNIRVEEMWEFINQKKAIIGKVFYLYYNLDMTIKDISKELAISESTVKNHIYRTLKELNTTFAKESDYNV